MVFFRAEKSGLIRVGESNGTPRKNESISFSKKLAGHTAMHLICLDHLQWLRNGRDVATHLHISQSSVSRQSAMCLQLYGLNVARSKGELALTGDLGLLRESRRLHQLFRISGFAELRIETSSLLASSLTGLEGVQDFSIACTSPRDEAVFVRLLYERIIDIWITLVPPDLCQIENMFGSILAPICLSLQSPLASLSHAQAFHIVSLHEAVGSPGFQKLVKLIS